MTTIFTPEQVATHNKENDCYIIIKGIVYDVTKFLPVHPAGKKILLNYAGTDASEIFNYFHGEQVLEKFKNLIIGRLDKIPKLIIPSH